MVEDRKPSGFYWLIPPTAGRGGLAGMARPNPSELAALCGAGIGLVVSLLGYTTLDASTPSSLRAIHLPVRNNDVPADAEFPQIALVCALMHRWRLVAGSHLQFGPRLQPDLQLQSDLQSRPFLQSGVAVHCLYGEGRTGMMLACYRGYLLARRPSDPDALAPEETAAQIFQILYEMRDERGLGPNPNQVRFAQWFVSWLNSCPRRDFDAETEAEMLWRRQECGDDHKSGDDAGTFTHWQCDNEECLAQAVHPTRVPNEVNAPLWCPCCGQSGGRSIGQQAEA